MPFTVNGLFLVNLILEWEELCTIFLLRKNYSGAGQLVRHRFVLEAAIGLAGE
ncbi:MAG: hypothetical protein ABI188_10045 [Collimonas sp.]|uniref:hypothetical protein n=1 Tax=Collimonas sp. TaxID=1963772 RepID=UPI003263EC64